MSFSLNIHLGYDLCRDAIALTIDIYTEKYTQWCLRSCNVIQPPAMCSILGNIFSSVLCFKIRQWVLVLQGKISSIKFVLT
jgi:hypothetical protein